MFKPHPQIGLTLITLILAYSSLNAQEDFATIRKNVNVLAKDLQHDLNKSKDTLVLSSSKRMYRVYTIGDTSGIVDEIIDGFEYKIPLAELRKGRYAFAVDQLGRKIVFQILVNKTITSTINAVSLNDNVISDVDLEKEKPKVEIRTKREVPKPFRKYNLSEPDRANTQSRQDARIERDLKRMKASERKIVSNIKGE